MSKKYGFTFILLALALAFVLLNYKSEPVKQSAKAELPTEKTLSTIPQSEPTPAPKDIPHNQTETKAEPYTLDALNSGDDVREAFQSVDLWNPVDVTMLVSKLRKADPELVKTVFEERLDDLREKPRDRLLSIASEYAGDNLLGFWQKVLETKPKDVREIQAGEIEEPDYFRQQEIFRSIRAIRLIANTETQAREYLERLVLDPTLHQGDLGLRKQAFFAVREVDAPRSLRILKQLDVSDALNSEIIAP